MIMFEMKKPSQGMSYTSYKELYSQACILHWKLLNRYDGANFAPTSNIYNGKVSISLFHRSLNRINRRCEYYKQSFVKG